MNQRTDLSPFGEQRRKAMLPQLQNELTRARQRRQRIPMVGCLFLLVTIASYTSFCWWIRPETKIVERDPSFPLENQPYSNPRPFSDHSANSLVTFEVIDDQQLLTMLAEAGKPSVLAEINGQLVVLPIRKN